MGRLEKLVPWVERLTGLESKRCEEAVAELRTWQLPEVEGYLLDLPDLDTVVAGVLLTEAVAALTAQGVERTKLMKKLRDARTEDQFWPVWAEIRAAAMLIGREDIEARIELEPARAAGRHADFRLHQAGGSSVDIEFKAVGLSDAEVAWHREAAEHFNRLLPPRGMSTAHGWLDAPITVGREKRQKAFEMSAVLSDELFEEFPAWAEVRGIAIVGHLTEEAYIDRTAGRLRDALGQFHAGEECYLGLWWGNGAPLTMTAEILQRAAAPEHVAGVVSIGQAVAVPWSEISCYIAPTERASASDYRRIDSTVDDHLAELILDRFDSSSGIRPTLLRAPGRDGMILLRRDGRRRIFPFNLLFDADPRMLAAPHRPPSPVQDVPVDM